MQAVRAHGQDAQAQPIQAPAFPGRRLPDEQHRHEGDRRHRMSA